MVPVIVAAAIAVLLLLILRFRMPAYLALLLVSMGCGLALGMDGAAVLLAIQTGMGSTLGFVAVVVGLGALLGALLEYSGGVHKLALRLLQITGHAKAGWAMGVVGFLASVAVFLDVAFIILIPLLYSLARDSQRSVLNYAVPLLAGMLVSHSFIPPTPGPIAVAELLGADLGLVILLGTVCGLPAMVVAGPLFARRFQARPLEAFLQQNAEALQAVEHAGSDTDDSGSANVTFSVTQTLLLILAPLVFIVTATLASLLMDDSPLRAALAFLGHPFSALALTTLLAFVLLRGKGASEQQMTTCMSKALEPAGIVVLVTGAGGVFKQILTDSGAGLVLAELLGGIGLLPVLFAFLLALLVRIAQGSATVAMITAAGLVAPLQQSLGMGAVDSALLVIAIAAGASACSHVNDSGFWLVSRYLQLETRETLQVWTVLSTIVGVCGLLMVLLVSALRTLLA